MELVVTIIGFGNIGKTIGSLLIQYKKAQLHINVIDAKEAVKGAIWDLQHGSQLDAKQRWYFNNQALFQSSDFIFHCAGASVPKGKNRGVTRQASGRITEQVFAKYKPTKEPFIIVVANPVEIVTYITQKVTQLPKERIVGTGTMLDSARLNHEIQQEDSSFTEAHAVILGEHGTEAFVSEYWSRINDVSISKELSPENQERHLNKVKQSAERIKLLQRHTKYGVSYCALKIFEALQSKKAVRYPVSTFLPRSFMEKLDCGSITLSLYSEISERGVYPVLKYQPKEKEFTLLKIAADDIQRNIPRRFR